MTENCQDYWTINFTDLPTCPIDAQIYFYLLSVGVLVLLTLVLFVVSCLLEKINELEEKESVEEKEKAEELFGNY